jgi:hypothetical protein
MIFSQPRGTDPLAHLPERPEPSADSPESPEAAELAARMVELLPAPPSISRPNRWH